MTKYVLEYQFPIKCSLCNGTALSVIHYRFPSFWGANEGVFFTCERHRKKMAGVDSKTAENIILGKIRSE